jgi:AcrR family transcriptional regulator
MAMATSETKARILQAALEQFNEHGVDPVSTNHIAATADISPGNLYYHYRNKEQIVRELAETTFAEYGALWVLPPGRAPILADLQAVLRSGFQLQWKYRFFFRELAVLLRHDPVLRERYQQVYAQRVEQQSAFMQRFTVSGVFRRPLSPTAGSELFTACWVLSDFWFSFLEARGESIGPDQVEQGLALITRVLSPYLAGTKKD